MFNGELKRTALEKLKKDNERYQNITNSVTAKAKTLHNYRIATSKELIFKVESYINRLANSPKSFDKSVMGLRLSFEKFNDVIRAIESSDNVAIKGSTRTGAGIATGLGIVTFAPTTALAIATTFGTASTGTAISALSGAAASNAALAWLGGGALAAGGGGMAAGNALIALAGPIGWAFGGTAIVGGVLWVRKKNRELAEKFNQAAIEINRHISNLQKAQVEIDKIYSITKKHSEGAARQLRELSEHATDDYYAFTEDQKRELGALVNNINSLSNLLKKKIN